jgi:hypothetical protein
VSKPSATERIACSNSIRLDGRQWLVLALFALALVSAAAPLWKQAEEFPYEADYRIPFDLKEDYWLYGRFTGLAVVHCDTLVVGDSVVWGVYVKRQETLSHYLNKLAGRDHAANLGLVGAHPLALSGLIEHHAGSIRNKFVVLQCNPLWMTSPEYDLQDRDKPHEIFHARLIPQFWPVIPRYGEWWRNREEISHRMGIVVEQHSNFRNWTTHLQQAYYDRTDIPAWTLEHPYDNPLKPLTYGLPPSDNTLRQIPQPWYKDKTPQDFPWLDMEKSLQWRAFQRAVGILQGRGNRVMVLVGPFNEHMMTPPSRERYQKVKGTITLWLEEMKIAHLAPSVLPTEQYGDASHPLAEGYEMLARQLWDDPDFRSALVP